MLHGVSSFLFSEGQRLLVHERLGNNTATPTFFSAGVYLPRSDGAGFISFSYAKDEHHEARLV